MADVAGNKRAKPDSTSAGEAETAAAAAAAPAAAVTEANGGGEAKPSKVAPSRFLILPHTPPTIVYHFHVFDVEDRADGSQPGKLLDDKMVALSDDQGIFHLLTAVFGSQLSSELSAAAWKAKFAGKKYGSSAEVGYRTAQVTAEAPAALSGLRSTPGDAGWFASGAASFRFALVAVAMAEPGSEAAKTIYPVVSDVKPNGVPALNAEGTAAHLTEAERKEATIFRKHVETRRLPHLNWATQEDLLLRLAQRAGLKCRQAWEDFLQYSLLTRTREAVENRYSTTHTHHAEDVQATAPELSAADCLLAARRLGRRVMQSHFRKGVAFERGLMLSSN